MKNLELLLLESLFDKKSPARQPKKGVTLKEYIKFKKEFEEFQKTLKEEEKKNEPKDKITFWQKVLLLHVGSLAYFATLAIIVKTLLH